MYTIFIKEVPIILTDNRNDIQKNKLFDFDKVSIEKVLSEAESGAHDCVYLCHYDLKFLWKAFKNHFKTEGYKIEKAAGGLVLNDFDESLFIFRLGKWDLPKGKIEKDESKKEAAIREVKEECGIKNLSIERKLQNTYHIFDRKGKTTLKVTYWYLMSTNDNGKLIPQIEEDITDVVFKGRKNIKEALKNTYGNIKLLFQNFDD